MTEVTRNLLYNCDYNRQMRNKESNNCLIEEVIVMAKGKEVIIEVKDMNKNFGVTQALSHVDFVVKTGEIRGLIGENGSGKSTVSSIIAGLLKASSGEMYYKGKKWDPDIVLDAKNAGIAMIVQEAGAIPDISVAENIFIGDYDQFKTGLFIDKSLMNNAAGKALEKIGVTNINPNHPTSMYDIQQRKLIELARAMYNDPDVLIIDETTTALSQYGRDILYRIMHQYAELGKAVMIISHDLDELMEHCDTLTILRDGIIVDNLEKKDFDENKIKQKMVGREISGNYYRVDMDGYSDEVVLRAEYITTMTDLMCFSLELHKGEILGIGGLSDCGMHTLGKALYGLEDVIDGSVTLPGKNNAKITNAKIAFKNGMGYISKNRDIESLELNASIHANIASTGYKKNRKGLFLLPKLEGDYVGNQIKNLLVKCSGEWQPVSALSGGNKQKVVFGKWVAAESDILILDCPTRGVDIGVKAAMYQLIYKMKKQGKSIIMISEELSELCGMSDRLLIMKDGKLNAEFTREEGFSDHELINYMI